MARKPVVGARLVVRILAVVLLLSGLAAGVVIGIQKQPSESLSLQSASETETQAKAAAAIPPPDTNIAQRLPAGAELKLAEEENSQSLQAESQAAARAEQIGDSIAQRANAAAAAAKKRTQEGMDGLLPDAPTDCLSYTGVKQIGCTLLVAAGFEVGQMSCLDKLWTKESHWSVTARNPSGAYGIPQALPGDKMATYGPDWETNPVPQIKWGLDYIKNRYSTPCGAWGHSTDLGWY